MPKMKTNKSASKRFRTTRKGKVVQPAVPAVLHPLAASAGQDARRPNRLDFARWLVDRGITSLSLNPDSVIETWQNLAKSSA